MSEESEDILEKLIPELKDRRTGIGYLRSIKANPAVFKMLVCPFCDRRESCYDFDAFMHRQPLMGNPKLCYNHIGGWIQENGRVLIRKNNRADAVLESLSGMDEIERYEFLCSRCPYSPKCHDFCGESHMLQGNDNNQDLRRRRDLMCLENLWDFFTKDIDEEEGIKEEKK